MMVPALTCCYQRKGIHKEAYPVFAMSSMLTASLAYRTASSHAASAVTPLVRYDDEQRSCFDEIASAIPEAALAQIPTTTLVDSAPSWFANIDHQGYSSTETSIFDDSDSSCAPVPYSRGMFIWGNERLFSPSDDMFAQTHDFIEAQLPWSLFAAERSSRSSYLPVNLPIDVPWGVDSSQSSLSMETGYNYQEFSGVATISASGFVFELYSTESPWNYPPKCLPSMACSITGSDTWVGFLTKTGEHVHLIYDPQKGARIDQGPVCADRAATPLIHTKNGSAKKNRNANQRHRTRAGKGCPYCGIAITRIEHYRRHVRTVHENGSKNPCKLCPKSFNRKDNLRAHYWTHVYRGGRAGRNKKMSLADLQTYVGMDEKLLKRFSKKLDELKSKRLLRSA